MVISRMGQYPYQFGYQGINYDQQQVSRVNQPDEFVLVQKPAVMMAGGDLERAEIERQKRIESLMGHAKFLVLKERDPAALKDAKKLLRMAIDESGGEAGMFTGFILIVKGDAARLLSGHAWIPACGLLEIALFIGQEIGSDDELMGELREMQGRIPERFRSCPITESEVGAAAEDSRSPEEVRALFEDAYRRGEYVQLAALARQYAAALQREEGGGLEMGFEQLEFDVSSGVGAIVDHAASRSDNYYVFFCKPDVVNEVKRLIGAALVAGSKFGKGIKVIADKQIGRAGTVRVFAGGDDILAIVRYDQAYHGAPPIAAEPGTAERPSEDQPETSETYRDYYRRSFTVDMSASSTGIVRFLQGYIDEAMHQRDHYFAIVAGHEMIDRASAAFRQIVARYSRSRNRQTRAAAGRVESRMRFLRDGSMSCEGSRCQIMFVGATSPSKLAQVTLTGRRGSSGIRFVDDGEDVGPGRRGSDDAIRLPMPPDAPDESDE